MEQTRDKTRMYSTPHDAPGASCIVTKLRKDSISESMIQALYYYDIVGNKVMIRTYIMDSEMSSFLNLVTMHEAPSAS